MHGRPSKAQRVPLTHRPSLTQNWPLQAAFPKRLGCKSGGGRAGGEVLPTRTPTGGQGLHPAAPMPRPASTSHLEQACPRGGGDRAPHRGGEGPGGPGPPRSPPPTAAPRPPCPEPARRRGPARRARPGARTHPWSRRGRGGRAAGGGSGGGGRRGGAGGRGRGRARGPASGAGLGAPAGPASRLPPRPSPAPRMGPPDPRLDGMSIRDDLLFLPVQRGRLGQGRSGQPPAPRAHPQDTPHPPGMPSGWVRPHEWVRGVGLVATVLVPPPPRWLAFKTSWRYKHAQKRRYHESTAWHTRGHNSQQPAEGPGVCQPLPHGAPPDF